jgi:hypothetical protein
MKAAAKIQDMIERGTWKPKREQVEAENAGPHAPDDVPDDVPVIPTKRKRGRPRKDEKR